MERNAGGDIRRALLFYGDGMITPAISGAVRGRGLEITPVLKPYVILSTIIVLIGLFAMQRQGTHSVNGKLFGPIMVLWFCCLRFWASPISFQGTRSAAGGQPRIRPDILCCITAGRRSGAGCELTHWR